MTIQASFDPEGWQRAFDAHVARLYGWSPGTAPLDERLIFYLRLVAETGNLAPAKRLVDLGAGMSAFGPVARALGLEVTLVDDFGGGGGVDNGPWEDGLAVMRRVCDALGINLLELDFLRAPLPLETQSVDVVTCFHSLEHWHHSPKRLFAELTRIVKPGGFLILATPNAANLRKRFACLFGRNIHAELEEWYYEGDPVFRGHVREPIVRDLKQLLVWNGFEVVAVHGRNFIGRQSHALGFLPRRVVWVLVTAADKLLRCWPTLCSDIHVVGRRGESVRSNACDC